MRRLTYEEQTFAARNPLARYSHRRRISIAEQLVLKALPDGGSQLDFGSGEGHLLTAIRRVRGSSVQLFGYDPFKDPGTVPYQIITQLSELPAHSMDVITAFETFEHMFPKEQIDALVEFGRLLRPPGHIILSVPIMVGPILLPKLINSICLKRKRTEYSLIETLQACVGGEVPPAQSPRHSHKGFDFRRLRRNLLSHFKVESEFYSPLPVNWYGVNSQYFVILSTA
jgi:SAM-dependent methyltransferase